MYAHDACVHGGRKSGAAWKRRDWSLPILAGVAAVGLRFLLLNLLRWIDGEPLSMIHAREIIYRFVLGAITMFLAIAFVRSIGALFLSFVTANVCQQILWFVLKIFPRSPSSPLFGMPPRAETEMLFKDIASGILMAALFYGAISYHLEERGFRLLRRQIVRTS